MISKLFRISVVTSIVFLLFANLASAAVLDVTNSQKLSLDPNTTTVGKKVRVSDGFYVSGANDTEIDGFYYPNGILNSGRPQYQLVGKDSDHICYWNGEQWAFNFGYVGPQVDTDYPWQADWSNPDNGAYTLTHPVIQKLTAPSSDLNAVFISGGGSSEVNGIYTKRGISASKPYYKLLGASDDDDAISEIVWTPGFGGFWNIFDSVGTEFYYSTNNVSRPDLVTTWQNVDDDSSLAGSAPSPSVSAITQGELDAGVTVSGAGTVEANGTIPGPIKFFSGGDPGNRAIFKGIDVNANQPRALFSDLWQVGNPTAGTYISHENFAFPWEVDDWIADDGSNPAPTVTRNNIATEANWALFTPVATSIQFGTQPSNTNVDTAISPAVTVQILDQDGDLITTATNNVTISIGTNPGSGTLSGTLTQAAVAGVATFDNLKIDKGGTGYTLSAAVSGAGTATSDTFNIIAPTVTTTVHTGGGRMAPPPSNVIPNTQNNSNNSNIPPPATPPKCIITNTLALGWVGPQVKCLQTILNIKVDGIFGKKTKIAVIAFQKVNGLKPDGIVGALTRNKLNALQQ